jgi:hypothetical protein
MKGSPNLGWQGQVAIASVMILSALFYLFLRADFQTPDSLRYAVSIRSGEELFHPHHLLFSPLVRLLYLGLRQLSPGVGAIAAAQIHNVCWAAICVGVVALIFWRLFGSLAKGILTSCGLAVCNGFWTYSTQAEVYIPAMCCLAIMTWLLISSGDQPFSRRRLIGIAAFFALSILYHQTNVLFAIPLFYLLARLRPGEAKQNVICVLFVSTVVVSTTYVVTYLTTDAAPSISHLTRYILTYAAHPNPDWGRFSHFGLTGVGLLLKSQLRDIIYLPDGARTSVMVAVSVFALMYAALILYHLFFARGNRPDYGIRFFLLIWLITYHFFFLWWLPGDNEFFLATLIPLILLAVMAVSDFLGRATLHRHRLPTYGIASGLLLVLLINCVSDVIPKHSSRGAYYDEAKRIDRFVPSNCVILVNYGVQQHLRYYFRRDKTLEVTLPVLYATQKGRIPDKYAIAGSHCAIVPLDEVSSYYNLDNEQLNVNRNGWDVFRKWLYGSSIDSTGAETAAFTSLIVRDTEGNQYLQLLPH